MKYVVGRVVTCFSCGHRWTARVPVPEACPECGAGQHFAEVFASQYLPMRISDSGHAGAGTICDCGRMIEIVKRGDGKWRCASSLLVQVKACCIRTVNELVSSMTRGDRAMDLTDEQVEKIAGRLRGQIGVPAVETLSAIEELQRRRKAGQPILAPRWVPPVGIGTLEEMLAFVEDCVTNRGPSTEAIVPVYPLQTFLRELKGWRSGPASRPDPTPTVRVPLNLPSGEARVSVSLAEEILRNQYRELQDLRAAKQKTDDEVAEFRRRVTEYYDHPMFHIQDLPMKPSPDAVDLRCPNCGCEHTGRIEDIGTTCGRTSRVGAMYGGMCRGMLARLGKTAAPDVTIPPHMMTPGTKVVRRWVSIEYPAGAITLDLSRIVFAMNNNKRVTVRFSEPGPETVWFDMDTHESATGVCNRLRELLREWEDRQPW